MRTEPKLADQGEEWLRQWTVPEEDRAKFTSEPWRGEARWFRSPNVVCFASWKRSHAAVDN
jgi:hypothetical protein